MPASSLPIVGFVPTLEVLPLIAENALHPTWVIQPFPSYGRIVRKMLAHQIAAGLLPLEVFSVEIASRPALAEQWCVPLVLPASPIELVLGRRMMKSIQTDAATKATLDSLVVGIESKNSLTRHQFVAWQRTQPSLAAAKAIFRMLPMELMRTALEAETIDCFSAPTPWGVMAEQDAGFQVLPDISSGRLAQQLVVCCHRDSVESHKDEWTQRAQRIAIQRAELEANASAYDAAVSLMAASGRPKCHAHALRLAAERCATMPAHDEFCPSLAWLNDELQKIGKLIPSIERFGSVAGPAKKLVIEG